MTYTDSAFFLLKNKKRNFGKRLKTKGVMGKKLPSSIYFITDFSYDDTPISNFIIFKSDIMPLSKDSSDRDCLNK